MVLTASCGGDNSPPASTAPASVATVDVSPPSLSLIVGQTGTLVAQPRDKEGSALAGRSMTWSSSDVNVATVSSIGGVTAVSAGTATITATSEGKSGTATVTVALAPVASVDVTPSSLSLVVKQTGTLVATPRDQAGNVLAGRSVTWSSRDATVATVSSAGVVTGAAAGTATITATSEGKSGTATVNVALAPVASVDVTPSTLSVVVKQTGTLVATPRDQAGNALAGRSVTWSSSDATVASVSLAGVVTGAAVGTATITATSEGKSGTAAVTVAPAPTIVSVGNWTSLGPHHIPGPFGTLASGKLQALAVYGANPSIMYAGGGLGSADQGPFSEAGAFRTTDGGATWSPINSGLSDPVVNAMWVDQTNSNVVLAGTESGGIFRSSNGGQTWSLAASFGATSEFVSAAGKVYAATAAGVAQSTDAGATWSIALATAAPVRVLAAGGGAMIAGLGSGVIMMQSSPGAAWQTVRNNPGRFSWSVAIDPANPLTAYALLGFHPSTLIGTSDGGVTWSTLTPCDLAQALAMTGASHVLYVGCNGVLVSSSNAGQSWTPFQNVTWDIRRLLLLPGETTIVLGTDQGLYRTSNAGSTWTGLTGSVYSSILTGVAVHGSTIVTAVQDFSPILSFDGGTNWQQPVLTSANPPIGEDGQVLINPASPSYCYLYTTAGYQYSTDGCRTFHSTGLAALGSLSYLQPGGMDIVAVDPRTPSTVYAASQTGVFRSLDWGVTMSPTGWPMAQASAIAIDPSDSRVIYVGTSASCSGRRTAEQRGQSWVSPVRPAIRPRSRSIR
jgi:uncharacterized protein YjdB